MLETVVVHNRKTGIETCGLSIILFAITLIIGLIGNMTICKYYLVLIIGFYLVELFRCKFTKNKTKNLGFELIIIFGLMFIGYKISSFIRNKIKM